MKRKDKGSPNASLAKWKLFYQGKEIIDNYIAKIEKIYYAVHAVFLAIELSLLLVIILLHENLLAVTALLTILIVVVSIQLAFYAIMRSVLAQEVATKFLAIAILIAKKGIINLSPDIKKINSWYGYLARKIYSKKKFTSVDAHTYDVLSKEWSGSYGELLDAVEKL